MKFILLGLGLSFLDLGSGCCDFLDLGSGSTALLDVRSRCCDLGNDKEQTKM